MTKKEYKEYCDMLQSNVDVFRDTRFQSQHCFKYETEQMINDTEIYRAEWNYIFREDDFVGSNISVINSGTVNAAYKIKKNNFNAHVAMLNFADAKRPGGWIIDGAPTQEENMCRCTNLYESLITDKCDLQYYKVNNVNNNANKHDTEAYTDTIIYSPGVMIFKKDDTYEKISPKFVDVITCPAPCGPVDNAYDVIANRIRKMLMVAFYNGVTDIVFGAWGCGAFGQKPKVVAKAFADVLAEYPVIKNVVFAIKETPGYKESSTIKTFRKILK